ncbi:MAG: methyltransferase domain-containing protein [Opitutaceae bacterium]|nr:methyltransferase domain-containing protein [Opitutaceae bacterium]
MIERILQAYANSTFDFRGIAHEGDSLKRLWAEWVPYYRMKAAIAAAIQPTTIFEFGVRYGYSAAAFLHGSPRATYTGIDLDVAAFGGVRDGLAFARTHLPASATLIKGDSQTLKELPGDYFDLVHVDGQQDEAGFYRDMELAIRKAGFILVDGYFWTRDNFLAASEFLLRHRELTEYSLAIPGYAGELLIKVKRQTPSARSTHGDGQKASGSAKIRDLYTKDYYQFDCGGWEYQQGLGRRLLDDARLRAVYNLAVSHSPRRLLDIGCGRGEICRLASQSGIACVGIDYSADAIAIAAEAASLLPKGLASIQWLCIDANALPENEPFDVIVLSDVIEHLTTEEVDGLLHKTRRLLTPNGRLIVHTFPNLWFYEYHYKRRLRKAAEVGAYLPVQPRSRREREMHINEWNPRSLRRILRKHFPSATLWFGSPENPVASMKARMGPRELAAQRDLFAVASMGTVDACEVLRLYLTQPLSRSAGERIRISHEQGPFCCHPGETLVVSLSITNGSDQTLSSEGDWPTFISYHLLSESDEMIVFEGHRSRFVCSQLPGSTHVHPALVSAPQQKGSYRLQLTLVQERVSWLCDWSSTCVCESKLIVS